MTTRWIVAWTTLGVVTALSIGPQADSVAGAHLWDKGLHAGAYTAMTAAFLAAAGRRGRRDWTVAAAVMVYGTALEGVQILLPSRTADPSDLLANAIGVGAAIGMKALVGTGRIARIRQIDQRRDCRSPCAGNRSLAGSTPPNTAMERPEE